MADDPLPPCPATWDCYGDGAMRCCREDGHEGWHRPSPDVWSGVKKILAAPRVHPTVAAVLLADSACEDLDCGYRCHDCDKAWNAWIAAGRPGLPEEK